MLLAHMQPHARLWAGPRTGFNLNDSHSYELDMP